MQSNRINRFEKNGFQVRVLWDEGPASGNGVDLGAPIQQQTWIPCRSRNEIAASTAISLFSTVTIPSPATKVTDDRAHFAPAPYHAPAKVVDTDEDHQNNVALNRRLLSRSESDHVGEDEKRAGRRGSANQSTRLDAKVKMILRICDVLRL